MKVQGDNYELHYGDCLEVMMSLPAGSVDAVITDPPYGTTACSWDSVIPFAPMWEAIKHVLKPRGAVVLFGSEPFSSLLRVSNLDWYKYDWVWDKVKPSSALHANHMPLKSVELISVFGNGAIEYNPQMSLSKRRKETKNDRNGGAFGDNRVTRHHDNKGLSYPKVIIKFSNADQTNALHPTQKPVALLEYLTLTYTNPGDTILDFTMGSCSTGKAAIKNGRKFIGIDNGRCEKENSEYYGWTWVEYAEVALANAAGDFTLTPAEKATGQMALLEALV
jgi:site-specific DNA-methyltransferase (adenine-specific)